MKYIFLTKDFYDDHINCSEIEQKWSRPYVMVKVDVDGVTFAVPMRSHITHNHVLWTDRENSCGLDFTKAVVISKAGYIDSTRQPHIRPAEFNALRGKEYAVKQQLLRYIHAYKKAKTRLDVPRNQQLCTFSTLQYFEQYI